MSRRWTIFSCSLEIAYLLSYFVFPLFFNEIKKNILINDLKNPMNPRQSFFLLSIFSIWRFLILVWILRKRSIFPISRGCVSLLIFLLILQCIIMLTQLILFLFYKNSSFIQYHHIQNKEFKLIIYKTILFWFLISFTSIITNIIIILRINYNLPISNINNNQWKKFLLNFTKPNLIKKKLVQLKENDNIMNQEYIEKTIFDGIMEVYSNPKDSYIILERLYTLDSQEFGFYLPQICSLLIFSYFNHTNQDTIDLENFLIKKCTQHHHFALRMYWFIQAYYDDDSTKSIIEIKQLLEKIKAAGEKPILSYANGFYDEMKKNEILLVGCEEKAIKKEQEERLLQVAPITDNFYDYKTFQITTCNNVAIDIDSNKMMAQNTNNYNHNLFIKINNFLEELAAVSISLIKIPIEQRNEQLKAWLKKIEVAYLPSNYLYIPVGDINHTIKRINYEESFVFSTKERVPIFLCFEVIAFKKAKESLHVQPKSYKSNSNKSLLNNKFLNLFRQNSSEQDHKDEEKPISPSHEKLGFWSDDPYLISPKGNKNDVTIHVLKEDNDDNIVIFKETWDEKSKRVLNIENENPETENELYRCLLPTILKSNDDLRQEQFALQLIKQFYKIVTNKGGNDTLNVFIKPYDVIAIRSKTGFLEVLKDTISLDLLKKKNENYSTLRNFYLSKFSKHNMNTEGNNINFKKAKENFIRSCAGYSILCYILQIKDRHNGNILIDSSGHLIHIDFGFFLANHPGNVTFETAPFKLTEEFVELMDGPRSSTFNYFRLLCVNCFLMAKKNQERITLLVEMMILTGNDTLPCFDGNPMKALQELKKRFRPDLDMNKRNEIEEFVHELIDTSLDNWRTKWYDKYQRWCAGVF